VAIVNDGRYAPAGGETISRSMSGWLKTGSASAIDYLAADVCKKIAHSPRKLLVEKRCSRNLLTMSKFIASKNLLNKFAHGESNLLTENHELPFSLFAI
jgi:hypothetical protein